MKLMAWLTKLALSTVLVSAISIFTSLYIVNTYIETVFNQLNIKMPYKSLQISDLLSRLSSQTKLMKTEESSTDSNNQADLTGESTGRNNGTDTVDEDGGDNTADAESKNDYKYPADEAAVAAWSQASHYQDVLDQKKEVIISAEDFYKKKESLSNEEKMKIFSILASKVPQEEMQKISTFVENGITKEEFEEVEEIIEQYLEQSEYDELVAIMNKY